MKISFFGFIKLVILILSFLAFFIVGENVSMSGYENLPFLPLAYFISFLFFLSHKLDKHSSIFFIVFNIVVFFRFVVLPYAIVDTSYYGGRSLDFPDADSLTYGHWLMIYELFLTSILASYFEKKYKNTSDKTLKHDFRFNKNLVFTIFSLLVIGFMFIDNSWLLSISFFIPNQLNEYLEEKTSFLAYFFIIVKQIIFVALIYKSFLGYKRTGNKLYFITVFLLLVLNVGIFAGTNRSDVVVSFIVSVLLVYKLFGLRFSKWIGIVSFIGLLALISLITEARNMSNLTEGNNVEKLRTDFLQVYLGGPYNVAIAVETKEDYPEASSIKTLFYDITRPMLGVNFLVKDMDLDYSNIFFNRRLFKSEKRSQIIPMIGQGNLYLGFIFAPLFSMFFVWLAYKMQNFIHSTSNVLVFYFFSLSIARMGFLMGQNSMNMINDISFNIFLFLIVFLINQRIKI